MVILNVGTIKLTTNVDILQLFHSAWQLIYRTYCAGNIRDQNVLYVTILLETLDTFGVKVQSSHMVYLKI